MCECNNKLKQLLSEHRRCRRMTEPKPEFKDPELARPKTPEPLQPLPEPEEPLQPLPEPEEPEPLPEPEEPEPEESEDEIELTDISPEELQEQEKEAERIKQELAMIELTKLTRKKVRKTK